MRIQSASMAGSWRVGGLADPAPHRMHSGTIDRKRLFPLPRRGTVPSLWQPRDAVEIVTARPLLRRIKCRRALHRNAIRGVASDCFRGLRRVADDADPCGRGLRDRGRRSHHVLATCTIETHGADGLGAAARDGGARLRDAQLVDVAGALPDEAIAQGTNRGGSGGCGIQHESSDAVPLGSGCAQGRADEKRPLVL